MQELFEFWYFEGIESCFRGLYPTVWMTLQNTGSIQGSEIVKACILFGEKRCSCSNSKVGFCINFEVPDLLLAQCRKKWKVLLTWIGVCSQYHFFSFRFQPIRDLGIMQSFYNGLYLPVNKVFWIYHTFSSLLNKFNNMHTSDRVA